MISSISKSGLCNQGHQIHSTTDIHRYDPIWHQRLGHIGYTSIKHLGTSTTPVVVKATDAPAQEYEVCHQSKARQQISRVPQRRGEKPFERVHFDLIFFNESYDSGRYCAHFYCDYSQFHISLNLTKRGEHQLMESIQWTHRFMLNKEYKIKRFHLDNESGLFNVKTPKNLEFSGRPYEYDSWALTLINFYREVQQGFLAGKELPEEYKIRKTAYLLPVKFSQQWTTTQRNQEAQPIDKRELPDFRATSRIFVQDLGKSATWMISGSSGFSYNRPAQPKSLSMSSGISLSSSSQAPSPKPHDIAMRIISGLKKGVQQELNRLAGTLPDPTTNLLQWQRSTMFTTWFRGYGIEIECTPPHIK